MSKREDRGIETAYACGYDDGLAEGRDNERKAIVDWLRKSGYNQIAYCIEKEAHRE